VDDLAALHQQLVEGRVDAIDIDAQIGKGLVPGGVARHGNIQSFRLSRAFWRAVETSLKQLAYNQCNWEAMFFRSLLSCDSSLEYCKKSCRAGKEIMKPNKPRLFKGSSTERIKVAEAIQAKLDADL